MELTFLQAADGTPLTKTFRKTGSAIEKVSSYPLVYKVTSLDTEVNSLSEFAEVITEAGDSGAALLKGNLAQPLNNESRAGQSLASKPTDWVVLDLDFDEGFDSVDAILEAIDPVLLRTNRVVQKSSSAGLTGDTGVRAHVFFKLSLPVTPSKLRDWLVYKNLTTPEILKLAHLSPTKMAMHWPLDPSVHSNAKLIFIAPPICEGFTDPLRAERIQYIEGQHEAIDSALLDLGAFNVASEVIAHLTKTRKESGFSARKPSMGTTSGGTEICKNPEPCEVTGAKEMNGFMRLNLDKGNESWGYYYPLDNPTILYNFKGEPNYYLKDVAPEYYRSLKRDAVARGVPDSRKFFSFTDVQTDQIFRGWYDEKLQDASLNPCSRQSAFDWLENHGEPRPSALPYWTRFFDPTDNTVVDATGLRINEFRASQYLNIEPSEDAMVPPTINKIVGSVCVDEATKARFLNWLAFIFQTRKKAKTAWIFHGTTGIGKGVLFDKVLKPLLGHEYVKRANVQAFSDQFNDFLEKALIVWVDETAQDTERGARKMVEIWKEAITEDTVTIRAMRANRVERPSFCSFIFATNRKDPSNIGGNDRRHNVAPAQYNKLLLSQDEIDSIADEIEEFAQFLAAYECDEARVRTPLENEARSRLIRDSQTTTELFFDSLGRGDLDYIAQEYAGLAEGETSTFGIRNTAREAIRRWVEEAAKADTAFLAIDELNTVYSSLHTGRRMPAKKFTRMLMLHMPEGVEVVRRRVGTDRVRGIELTWTNVSEDTLKHTDEIESNVINFSAKE